MELEVCTWKRFSLQSLFDIRKGKRLTAEVQTAGNTLYIGAIDSNNGVAAHIGQEPIHFGNTISLSYNGSVGEAFYQEEPYWATDDVNALYCKYGGFNKWIALFIVTVLRQEKYRFSYGRKWTLENMKNTQIKLPIKINDTGIPYIDHILNYSPEGYVPDWQFMEDYIKSLHCKPVTTHNISNGISLDYRRWKEFRLGDLLSRIYKANSYCSEELVECSHYDSLSIPYITRTDTNNGCQFFVKKDDAFRIEAGNAITIGDTTSTIFYQENEFICGDHIVILRSPFFNKFTASFIITLLQKERYRYNYGRAFLKELIENTKLLLPVGIDNNPNWQYMEDYIKSLPYGDRI